MIALYIALGFIGVYLVFCIVAAILLVRFMVHPKFDTREARKIRNEEKGLLKGTEDFKREPIVFEMKDGYKIHGDISLNNPKKFVIFGHGRASTREGSMRLARLIYPLGYSVVLYDHRGHGDNERTYPTMGKRESEDMIEIVHQIKKMYGYDCEVGLFGCSMGGATTCLASHALNKEISFAIIDCAYASLKNLLKGICLTHFVPLYPTIWIVNLITNLFYKFSFKDIDCTKEEPDYDVPMLFIHGKEDKMVLYNNSVMLYNKTRTEKKVLKIFEKVGHGICADTYPEEYKQAIKEFLNKVGEKNGEETPKA